MRTKSMISRKCTSTHSSRSGKLAELWMSSDILPCLIFEAPYPNTNKRTSIVLDFPHPLGPTMEKDCRYQKRSILRVGCWLDYFVERANLLPARITLEVDQGQLVNNQTWFIILDQRALRISAVGRRGIFLLPPSGMGSAAECSSCSDSGSSGNDVLERVNFLLLMTGQHSALLNHFGGSWSRFREIFFLLVVGFNSLASLSLNR